MKLSRILNRTVAAASAATASLLLGGVALAQAPGAGPFQPANQSALALPGEIVFPDGSGNLYPPSGGNPLQIGGNVGGKTVSVCVTPTVTTANAYGANYVVGGLLTFNNAFTATGSGILQGVVVTIKKVETGGFTFVPFNANPGNTTWTDAAAANINAADVGAVRAPVPLAAYSGLGTHTVAAAAGLGEALAPRSTALYGVLLANAGLTNNFAGAGDVQVCVAILQDL